MKFLVALIVCSISLQAFAEHEGTYCGTIVRDARAQTSSGVQPRLVLAVEFRKNESGAVINVSEGYAAVLEASAPAVTNIARFQRSAASNTIICAKGRWSGSTYNSWDIEGISLTSDAVTRVDTPSALGIRPPN